MKLRKYISMMIAAAISVAMLGSMTASTSETTDKTRKYIVYNYTSESEVSTYELSVPLDSSIQSRSLIGDDERVEYAHSGIVRLEKFATGFIVGDHTIATAAHCVFEKAEDDQRDTLGYGVYVPKFDVTLYNDSGAAVKEIEVSEAHLPDLYKTCPFADRFKYDYALLTVTEDLSDYEHFKLGEVINGSILSSIPVSVCGFPINDTNTSDNVVITPGKLYIDTNNIIVSNNHCIYYKADTSSGESGGPVFVTTRYQIGTDSAVETKTVIAIHAAAGNTNNGGTRMNSELLKFYLANSYNTFEE